MDKIFCGVILSSHPVPIKAAIIDKVEKAGYLLHHSSDIREVLICCKNFLVEKDDPQIEAWSKRVFTSWASNNYRTFEGYFTVALVEELLLSGYSNVFGVIWMIKEGLDVLQVHQLNSYASVCSSVGNRATNFVRDNSEFRPVVDFCHILLDHSSSLPPIGSPSLRTFCSVLLKVVSEFTFSCDSHYLHCIPNVIGKLLQRVWVQDREALTNSLRTVFDVICSCRNPEALKTIGGVVQFIPNESMLVAVWAEATATKLSDQLVMNLLGRMTLMLTWPFVCNIDTWIVCYMRGLASVGRYRLLSEFASNSIDQLFSEICDNLDVRGSVFPVVSYMLLSHQHSPALFHKIVGRVPHYVKELQRSPSSALSETAELLHCLMFQHSGFPDLYGPILDAIKDCPQSSLETIRQRLAECAWSKDITFQMKPSNLSDYVDESRSETGLTGLCNLGNTCYANSVLQALYMCDSFRHAVLRSAATPVLPVLSSLQEVFAFLSFTQRSSYSPDDFLRVSRPSWFADGHQQDCSEFLRHLLNILNDQEHAHHRSQNGATQQSPGGSSISNSSDHGTVAHNDDVASLVSETFGGYTLTTYRCLGCQTCSSKKEPFMDLQLAFPAESKVSASAEKGENCDSRVSEQDESAATKNGGSSISLVSLLDHFLHTERLDGANQYKCEGTCQSLQNAERSTQIVSAPPYLVMTLLRFGYNEGRHTKKLSDVSYPLSIQVPVVERAVGSPDLLQCSRTYGLVGVVIHSGLSSDHGHYYCYARHSRLLPDVGSRPVMRAEGDQDTVDHFVSSWYMFNDSRVTHAAFGDFRNVTRRFNRDTAYLLIYRRVDGDDVDAGDVAATEPPLLASLREVIDRDNERYLQELQRRKSVRTGFTATFSQRSFHNDDEDDDSPPNNCGMPNSGSGNFLQGPPSIF